LSTPKKLVEASLVVLNAGAFETRSGIDFQDVSLLLVGVPDHVHGTEVQTYYRDRLPRLIEYILRRINIVPLEDEPVAEVTNPEVHVARIDLLPSLRISSTKTLLLNQHHIITDDVYPVFLLLLLVLDPESRFRHGFQFLVAEPDPRTPAALELPSHHNDSVLDPLHRFGKIRGEDRSTNTPVPQLLEGHVLVGADLHLRRAVDDPAVGERAQRRTPVNSRPLFPRLRIRVEVCRKCLPLDPGVSKRFAELPGTLGVVVVGVDHDLRNFYVSHCRLLLWLLGCWGYSVDI